MLTHFEAQQILRSIPEALGNDRDHPVYQAAMLLLLGLGRRKHLGDLSRLSGYSHGFVQSCLRNWRASGTWKGEDKDTYENWERDPILFVLDAMVGAGVIVYQSPSSSPRK